MPPGPPPQSVETERPTYYRQVQIAGSVEAHAIDLPSGAVKPPSRRNEALLVLVLDGSMETQLDGHPAQRCESLSFSYHPPGQSGSGSVGPDGVKMFVLALKEADARHLQSEGLAGPQWRPLDSPLLALKVLHEFAIADEESKWAIEETALSLFTESARRPLPSTRRPPWWRRLQECLHGDPPATQSFGALAHELGVHPVYLSATYRAIEGKTLGAARRERRIHQACRLIIQKDWSLGDIALEIGYADQAHFNRAFRRTMGFSPSRLRGLPGVFTSPRKLSPRP